ncbi:MAG: hypothetical protein ABRQ24_01785 [Syntrophomonadaceae bacterium]
MKYDMVEFDKEWLILAKHEFKILTMITVLAENKLAYRGTLTDMCRFMDITAQKNNTDKIKKAIKYLQDNKYLHSILDVNVYTLTLTKEAERWKDVISIKREWVYIAKDIDSETDWINVLKIWLYSIDNDTQLTKIDIIAEQLNITPSIVKRAMKALKNIGAIKTKKETVKIDENIYRCKGQIIVTSAYVNIQDY